MELKTHQEVIEEYKAQERRKLIERMRKMGKRKSKKKLRAALQNLKRAMKARRGAKK